MITAGVKLILPHVSILFSIEERPDSAILLLKIPCRLFLLFSIELRSLTVISHDQSSKRAIDMC